MNLGTHVIIDGCVDIEKSDKLNNIEFLTLLLDKLTTVCDLTIVNKCIHKFEPQGYTICYILAESHISIHTWPENNAYALDIYSCKHDLDVHRIRDILEDFSLYINITKLNRST